MIERPDRAMVIFAHPDDEVGCAGTVALWTSQGTEVAYVLCTNGDKGSEDPAMTSERLAQIRHKEQQDACAVLGVRDLTFLGYPDGELEDTREFRGQLVREIRRFRPQTVLTHSFQSGRRHNHRDHRTCGAVAMDAIFPYARDPLHFPELTSNGYQPHKVGTILLWGADTPDEFVDIGETLDIKVKAMLCHRSQFLDRPGPRRDREPGAFMRENAARWAEQSGLQYAEAFRMIQMRT